MATRPTPIETLESLGIERTIKTVCLDFDGVIHSYRSGWKGEGNIPDPPIHGVRESIIELRKRYRVVIQDDTTADGLAARTEHSP